MHINASFSTISMYDYAITFKASTVCSLRFVSQSSNRITNVLMTCAFMHVVARLRACVPLCMCLYVIVRFLADFALTTI